MSRVSALTTPVMAVLCVPWLLAGQLAALAPASELEEEQRAPLVQAIERALPLLEAASSGSADQRQCFTCHSQALPIFALTEANRRGFQIDLDNLRRQREHTMAHLSRGRELYQQGKGQGGGVDTAGYALWALEESEERDQEVIDSVTGWLIARQRDNGMWKCSSDRPPTETSDFTTTYLALRALGIFGNGEQQDGIAEANRSARLWLTQTAPKDTEDSVFRLLALSYASADEDVIQAAIAHLKEAQREDGGWAQLPDLASDAYATATAMYALLQVGGMSRGDTVWSRGVRFLLDEQLEDGSWLVKSRSKPFQTYYETGFPHQEHQFISTVATAWASIVLLQSLPAKEPVR